MGKLFIKNGKFYDGQNEVKPEIGNIDQINCLKEHERLKGIFDDGLIVDPKYHSLGITATTFFTCMCGRRLIVEVEADDIGDESCFIECKNIVCHNCNQRYHFKINDKHELVVVSI